MFPLFTPVFPASAADLARLLNESLRLLFHTQSEPVTVRDRAYPRLEALGIALTGARLRSERPEPPVISGAVAPALEIDQLNLVATPLFLGRLEVDLSLRALQVRLGQAKDSSGCITLTLESALDGSVEVSISRAHLEAFVAGMAQLEAGKHGVTIADVRLSVDAKSVHALAMEVSFRTQKLFMSASLRIKGQITVDDELRARIFGLACAGDGALATIACRILQPHLDKLNDREFLLMSLPLSGIQLRNVRMAADEKLSVTAEFGSDAVH